MPMVAPFDGYVETLDDVSSTFLEICDRCHFTCTMWPVIANFWTAFERKFCGCVRIGIINRFK
jgi:hypothetical protein